MPEGGRFDDRDQEVTPVITEQNARPFVQAFMSLLPSVSGYSPNEITRFQEAAARDALGAILNRSGGPGGLANTAMDEMRTFAPKQADLFLRMAEAQLPEHARIRMDLEGNQGAELADLYRGLIRGDQEAFVDQAGGLAESVRGARRASEGPYASAVSDRLLSNAQRELNAGSRLSQPARANLLGELAQSMKARGARGDAGMMADAIERRLSPSLSQGRIAGASQVLGQEYGQANRFNPFNIASGANTQAASTGLQQATQPVSETPIYGSPISGLNAAAKIVGAGLGVGAANVNQAIQGSNAAAGVQGQRNASLLAGLDAFNKGGMEIAGLNKMNSYF